MQTHSQTKLVLAVMTALILVIGGSSSFMTTSIGPALVQNAKAQEQPEATLAQPEATTTQQEAFNVQVSADDVQRGQMQTIKIQTDGSGSIVGIITYASGHKVLLKGDTDENGALDYPFKIGNNAKPGTFNVEIVAATDEGFGSNSTTFEVTKKGEVAVPAPEPVPEPIEPEEIPPEVIAPENETSVITPDNATEGGIEIPLNETSIVIPANETIVPDPSENDTAVIVVPENETEVATDENITDVEPPIPEEIIEELPEGPVIIAPGNESTVTDNTTAEEPIDGGNDTTTAPGEPVIVVPENETSVATPENDTGIIPPVNETSIIIPSNETTVPEPTTNETEIIIAPDNETEIVTPDNATEVEEIPPEIVDAINDTSVVVPGNVTEVGENSTISEPLPIDVIPADNATGPGNVSEIVVVPPEEGPGEIAINATEPGNATETLPELPFPIDNATAPTENGTVPAPEEETPPFQPPANETTVITPPITTPEGNETTAPGVNVTGPEPTPPEAIADVDNATQELEQAIDDGNQAEILRAMQEAIAAQQVVVSVVDTASQEEREDAQDKVEVLTDLIDQAFSQVSEDNTESESENGNDDNQN